MVNLEPLVALVQAMEHNPLGAVFLLALVYILSVWHGGPPSPPPGSQGSTSSAASSRPKKRTRRL